MGLMNTAIDTFMSVSRVDQICWIISTLSACIASSYCVNKLYKRKYNKYLVIGYYFASNIYTAGVMFGISTGVMSSTTKEYVVADIIFLLLGFFFNPFLFDEKYFDFHFLSITTELFAQIYVIAYFPIHYLREYYNWSIFVEGVLGIIVYDITLCTVTTIVKNHFYDKFKRVPLFVKVAFFIIRKILLLAINEISAAINLISSEDFTTISIIAVLFLFGFVLALLIVFKLVKDKEETTKLLTAMSYEDERKEWYEEIDKKNLEIRELSHDMNNHLLTIQALSQSNDNKELDDYLSELIENRKKSMPRFCDNRIADVVLSHKFDYAVSENVKIKIDTMIPQTTFISSNSLVSIISNVLDNAIYAAKASEDKFVGLTIRNSNEAFELTCENTHNNNIKKKGKQLLTTKDDKVNHGLGTKIIQKIVEAYNGKYKNTVQNGKFLTVIYIPKAENI